jgi:5-methylcytosine-specific restriction endonuclease McrA
LSITYLPAALRKKVRQRAQFRCEYCRLRETDAFLPHEADHVIAEKHGGASIFENLACSCFDCNRFKGSDISSIDPISRKIVPLYNPRTQAWGRHFRISGGEIIGRTTAGRATVKLLSLICQHALKCGRCCY